MKNRHIGRRVINEIIKLAKEKSIQELHAEIYSFNIQSQKMFQSMGFENVDDEQYVLKIYWDKKWETFNWFYKVATHRLKLCNK